MTPWLTEIIACPAAGPDGALEVRPDAGWFCAESGLAYPVLGDIPFVVPEPARWLAEHRDAVLAALAEHGLASERAAATIATLAEPWLDRAPEPFRDDWTRAERQGDPSPELPLPGPAAAALADLLAAAATDGALPRLLAEAGARTPRTVVEVGPGAGLLSRELAARCERLAVVDQSLRSVLLATSRAREARQAAVAAAVADADALWLRPESADAVVVANVLDLLEEPERFLEAVAVGLRPGGVLLACTPNPGLRRDEPHDDALALGAAEAGLTVVSSADGLPWVRSHSPREYQVFLCQLLVATKP